MVTAFLQSRTIFYRFHGIPKWCLWGFKHKPMGDISHKNADNAHLTRISETMSPMSPNTHSSLENRVCWFLKSHVWSVTCICHMYMYKVNATLHVSWFEGGSQRTTTGTNPHLSPFLRQCLVAPHCVYNACSCANFWRFSYFHLSHNSRVLDL